MTPRENRAAAALAIIFSVRLLGLFMIYPVFAAHARGLRGATPAMIGIALGIYGLSLGLLQIPFGFLSNRLGRKIMIAVGLLVFGVGSAVAALSTSVDGMIIGRVLQGGGAIGSVVLALLADLTREENRTKAMAIVGMSIGFSFMAALVLGPVLSGFVGVPGIFWRMVGLALEVLKQYTTSFAPQTVGLRGTPDQIAALAKRYRVAYSVEPSNNGSYEVTHSSAVYAFDRSGAVRLLLSRMGSSEPNLVNVAKDMRDLVSDSGHPSLWQHILHIM